MSALSLEELYKRHIKPLTPTQRLRLLAMTAQDLAQTSVPTEETTEATTENKSTGLSRFIGAAQGSFATPAEADTFIRQERDAWDS